MKTAVAVVAAVLLCELLIRGPFPTFAAIAALLVVQPSINQSFMKGLERSAGVLLGVVLATGVHLLLGDAVWIVLLVVVLAILLAWALRLTPTSATQVGISGMLVLTAGVVTPNYSADRILETVIGAVVALVVNAVIVPPVLLEPAHLAVARLARDTAAAFERIAVGLTEGWDHEQWDAALLQARALRQQHGRTEAALTSARDSLAMNPPRRSAPHRPRAGRRRRRTPARPRHPGHGHDTRRPGQHRPGPPCRPDGGADRHRGRPHRLRRPPPRRAGRVGTTHAGRARRRTGGDRGRARADRAARGRPAELPALGAHRSAAGGRPARP
ncbi:aromatic acid exporter family protein [Curtobacterium sp. MCPF17_052]|uniref:FUSC family protein n=1 Tax=Curtobacterium sp. MCPF17_052 TaxID=2175655 RepID=UPI0024E024AB|nr:aromatic acid exporter family protein [Curtobacterium sp. MCPF17_052]WIB12189.1 aromatic acid exporter family protein [Curtobacterium sp. MCPF17_052]